MGGGLFLLMKVDFFHLEQIVDLAALPLLFSSPKESRGFETGGRREG